MPSISTRSLMKRVVENSFVLSVGRGLSARARWMSIQRGICKGGSHMPTASSVWLTRGPFWPTWRFAPSTLNHHNKFFPRQKKRQGPTSATTAFADMCITGTWCATYAKSIRISNKVPIASRQMKSAPWWLSCASQRLCAVSWRIPSSFSGLYFIVLIVFLMLYVPCSTKVSPWAFYIEAFE